MPRLLIVKTGTTVPNVAARRGDFEAWITAGMGLPPSDAIVVRVDRDEALPEPDVALPIVVTGSAAMVSDREPWSEACAAWLRRAVEAGVPTLGICYGHQLLAHAFGGEVGPNPRGRSIGTIDVSLTDAGRDDPLLGPLDDTAHLPVSHFESVLRLPPATTRLACTARDPNHAFRFDAHARCWGVQFHPEFDADITRGYIEARAEIIAGEGLDADALRAAARDTDDGPGLLRRFAELSRG